MSLRSTEYAPDEYDLLPVPVMKACVFASDASVVVTGQRRRRGAAELASHGHTEAVYHRGIDAEPGMC
jgi:hypothetical protein